MQGQGLPFSSLASQVASNNLYITVSDACLNLGGGKIPVSA